MADDPHLAELERILKRDERGRAVGSAHAVQRLQPQAVAPPPEPIDFTADDLDPSALDEARPRRGTLVAAAAVGIVAVGVAGWLFWPAGKPPVGEPPAAALATPPAIPGTPSPARPPEPSPAIVALPVLPPAPPRAAAPDASAAIAPAATLVPPETAGLSPARKVRAAVILVEGDIEVPANRN
jgi:hypothetical protein